MSDSARPTICVSPAEPAWLKDGLAAHFDVVVSNKLTETRGVDISWHGGQARNGNELHWWGIQRKAVDDLLASVQDGRLAREVAQMNASTGVHMPFLVVEGTPRFTVEGVMIRQYGQQYTVRQWRGLLWSLQAAGIAVEHSDTRKDTVKLVVDFYGWSCKDKHLTLRQRPSAAANDWGTRNSKDWATHILQGFDGIGPEAAGAIYDAFGLPLEWTVGEKDLLGVSGIGKVRAGKLIKALTRVDI